MEEICGYRALDNTPSKEKPNFDKVKDKVEDKVLKFQFLGQALIKDHNERAKMKFEAGTSNSRVVASDRGWLERI